MLKQHFLFLSLGSGTCSPNFTMRLFLFLFVSNIHLIKGYLRRINVKVQLITFALPDIFMQLCKHILNCHTNIMRLSKACRCLWLYITLSALLFLLLQPCPCLQWHQRATMPSLLMRTPPTQSALSRSKNSPRPALQPATTARLWVSVCIPGCILWEIGLLIRTSAITRVDCKLLCCMLSFGAISSLYKQTCKSMHNVITRQQFYQIWTFIAKHKNTGIQNTCLFCYLPVLMYFHI